MDQIFLLQNWGNTHVFIVLTHITRDGSRDAILDQEIVSADEDNPVVIGVPAVSPIRLYMINIERVGTVWITWDPYYL